jgi:CRISPR-associated exonuclease Cas4
MYTEEDMLMLSGIQHYMFCPRQWGLIHLSQEWEDNRLTVEGQLLHENVDNPFIDRKMEI